MSKYLALIFLSLFLFMALPVVASEPSDVAAGTEKTSSIPYKEEKSISTSIGASVTAIIIFLVLAGVVVLYLKKFNIGQLSKVETGRNIELVETRRLSTRTIAFLIKVKGVDVLLVQSGDSIHSIKLGSDEDS